MMHHAVAEPTDQQYDEAAAEARRIQEHYGREAKVCVGNGDYETPRYLMLEAIRRIQEMEISRGLDPRKCVARLMAKKKNEAGANSRGVIAHEDD